MMLAKGCTTYVNPSFIAFGIFIFISILTGATIFYVISLLLMIFAILMLIFFRDPEVDVEGGIISPAHGKVQDIVTKNTHVRIMVFMNIWNIHVNRIPLAGKVISLIHKKGNHKPAFSKDADGNERVIIELGTDMGIVKVTQIAGSLARRIVPYVDEGQKLRKGEKIGLIRFGSRVDISLPENKVRITVKKGDKVMVGQKIGEYDVSGGHCK